MKWCDLDDCMEFWEQDIVFLFLQKQVENVHDVIKSIRGHRFYVISSALEYHLDIFI